LRAASAAPGENLSAISGRVCVLTNRLFELENCPRFWPNGRNWREH
jgi:hypothetical protein